MKGTKCQHTLLKIFFFLIEFKNTASICKSMVRYTKSANEKCLPGDVFVLTYGSMYGSYLWLCCLLVKKRGAELDTFLLLLAQALISL